MLLHHRRAGGIRLGLLFLFVAAALLWGGGQGAWTALRNTEPTELAMSDYARGGATAEWLALNDAYVNLLSATHMYRSDPTAPADRIFVAAYASAAEWEAETPRVVIETRDAELLAVYNDMISVPEGAIDDWIDWNWDRLATTRSFTGLVRFGIEMTARERELLRGVFETDEFIVLADGEAPQLGFSLVMLLLGGGAAFAGVRSIRRRRTDEPQPEPAPETAHEPAGH